MYVMVNNSDRTHTDSLDCKCNFLGKWDMVVIEVKKKEEVDLINQAFNSY